MSLKELNTVSGEYNMMKYYSIGMRLNDVIKDEDTEQIVLENIRRCSKLVGKFFKVVFWHDGLTEKQCKDFVKRNEKMLFEITTQITSTNSPFNKCWFLINSSNTDRCTKRYSYKGNVLSGIVEYIKVVKHLKRREDESSNRR